MGNAEAARDDLNFVPEDARTLGEPEAITLDGICVPRANRTLAFVFNDSRGRFLVLQRAAGQRTEESLTGLLAYNSPTNLTKLSTTSIRGNITALLIQAGGPGQANSIEWIEGGVDYVILGPMETFSLELAEQLANEL